MLAGILLQISRSLLKKNNLQKFNLQKLTENFFDCLLALQINFAKREKSFGIYINLPVYDFKHTLDTNLCYFYLLATSVSNAKV